MLSHFTSYILFFSLILFSQLLSGKIFSQQITWSKLYSDAGNINDHGNDVIQTYDGNFAILGTRTYDNNNLKILLIKLDVNGNVIWKKTVAESILTHTPYSFQQTHDSGFIITGVSGSAFLIKTDKNGDLQWRKVYNSTYPQTYASSLIITPDNGFIICGRVPFSGPPSDKGYLAKIDPDGDVVWERLYSDSTFTSFGQITLNKDNSCLYVSGSTYNTSHPLTYYSTVKKISLDGDVIWGNVFGINSSSESILLLDDSTIVINSRVQSTSRPKFTRFTSNGELVCDNIFDFPGFTGGTAIISKDHGNNIQKVGDYYNNISYSEISPSGVQLVLKSFETTGFLYTAGSVIKNCNDDGFIIVGTACIGTQSNNRKLIMVMKTDSNVNAPALTVNVTNNNTLIPSFKLLQNYPNPFNSQTQIQFQIHTRDYITISVYDILGREVKKLVKEVLNPGDYKINFDAKDLQSGIYYYTLNSKNHFETKAMVLIK